VKLFARIVMRVLEGGRAKNLPKGEFEKRYGGDKSN